MLRRAEKLLADRRHALCRQRARVFDLAVRVRMNNASRSVPFFELRILRIEIALGLFLGVEMVEIAEELIEAMIGRQMLVMIAEVVLAELTDGVALRLQGVRDCWHPFGDACADLLACRSSRGQYGTAPGQG
jgi:hypothetical protein